MPPIAVLVALADPTRCRIIEILRAGAQPVHVLAGSFDISRPAISRHLRVLKQARLISEKKLGRENRYALHAEKLKPLSKWLDEMQSAKPVAAAKVKKAEPPANAQEKPAAVVVVAPPKPTREAPINQMGFDF